MHTVRMQSLLRTLALTASVLAVGLIHPGLGHVASPKVDVCHREGNGSFHRITVAYQAVQAHRAHGDAVPGEAVPGNAGYKFDDTCAQVVASLCPCDFSLTHLATAGIDGQAGAFTCSYDSPTLTFIWQGAQNNQTINEALVDPDETKFCTLGPYGNPTLKVTDLTSDQVQACGDDLRVAVYTLGILDECH